MFKTRKLSQYYQRGFTIVELLIVIVVIAVLAAITVVAFNGITNRAKTSAQAAEISQWKRKSEVHKLQNNIECPANYVFVYGNSTLGTSDFCVMKYEVKIQGNDVGTTTYGASMVAESRATGTPWVNITQPQAITESIETGGHLLTDSEWMTIAADVMSVKYNWSGGAVGSGYIYSGHNDASPNNSLAAVTDDNDGYSGTGNSASSGDNQRRILYLSSGDVIWDFAGDVWEWTQIAIGTPTLTVNQIGVSGDSAFNTREYTNGSLSLGNLPANSRPSALATMPGLSSVTSWDATKGMGRISANYADTAARALYRGGRWSDNGLAGVLALGMSGSSSSFNTYIGFRVAR